MKENLQALNRNLLLKAMKTIFFIIPIGIITNNIFQSIFGNYSICPNLKYFSDYFNIICRNTIFSIIIFSSIFYFSYFLEKDLFPNIFLFINKRINNLPEPRKRKIILHKIFKKIFGFNPFLYLTEDNIKREAYKQLMYIPIMLSLWLIAINTILSYCMLFIIAFLIIYILMLLNTIINDYQYK